MKTVCPACSLEFEVRRSNKGAAYALEWEYLPECANNFLNWWSNQSFRDIFMTKAELITAYNLESIRPQIAIGARISELLTHDIIISTRHIKESHPDHIANTIKIPKYKLNNIRIDDIRKNNGKL